MTKRYAVKIPAGAKDGTRIRLKGKGEPGTNGGPPATSSSSSRSSRRRSTSAAAPTSCSRCPVTYAEAALGATVEIPTPEGPVSLKVPAGTESGKLLRVKGRGAPKLRAAGEGDLLAR